MTVRRRPQQHAKPGDPRNLWPMETLYPRNHKPDPTRAWIGTLNRADDGSLSGELRGSDKWVLTLSGQGSSKALIIRMWVGTTGGVLATDHGMGADLYSAREYGSWVFTMMREGEGQGFAGRIGGAGWALVVRGVPEGVGRLRLSGLVEAS